MIKIHRTRPMALIDDQPVNLGRSEHRLITTLGMLDNKLASYQLLLEVTSEHRVQIPADKDVLLTTFFRLRKKIGKDVLRCRRKQGLILSGPMQFVDEI